LTILYTPSTGEVLVSSVRDLDYAELVAMMGMLPEGTAAVPGFVDKYAAFFSDGGLTKIPAKPGDYYEWHAATQSWVFNQEAFEASLIMRRGSLLITSDWTQLPDSPLTTEQREEWAIYRQALRDITDQPGYPLDITWPIAPT